MRLCDRSNRSAEGRQRNVKPNTAELLDRTVDKDFQYVFFFFNIPWGHYIDTRVPNDQLIPSLRTAVAALPWYFRNSYYCHLRHWHLIFVSISVLDCARNFHVIFFCFLVTIYSIAFDFKCIGGGGSFLRLLFSPLAVSITVQGCFVGVDARSLLLKES
jgi:hypothetical protein